MSNRNRKQRVRRGMKRKLNVLESQLTHRSVNSSSQVLDIDRDLTLRILSVRSETLNEEERSIEAVITTDEKVEVFDWRRGVIDEVLVAGGAEYPTQVPLLDSHNRFSIDDQVGSIRNLRVESGQIIGRLYFASDEKSESAWLKVRDGHLTDLSGGYRVLEYKYVEAGQTEKIGGRSYTADSDKPLRVSTKWKLREGSLTPIGADEMCKIREQHAGHLTPAQTNTEISKMNRQRRRFLEKLGLRAGASDAEAWDYVSNLQDHQRQSFFAIEDDSEESSQSESQQVPAQGQRVAADNSSQEDNGSTATATVADENAVRADERQRIAEIRQLGGQANVPSDVIERAINEGHTVERASHNFLQNLRDSRPTSELGSNVNTGRRDANDASTLDAMAAAVCMRSGVTFENLPATRLDADGRRSQILNPDEAARFREQAANESVRFSQLGVIEFCRTLLSASGQPVPTTKDEVLRAASSGGQLDYIFNTSINAAITQGWQLLASTTSQWVEYGEVDNFLEREDVSIDPASRFKRHRRGGTAHHIGVTDRGEKYRLFSFSAQFEYTREDAINDRWDVLQSIPAKILEQAGQLEPDAVYSYLLSNPNMADSSPLFQAVFGNLRSGGNTKLSQSAVKNALIAFMNYRINGQPINVQPTTMLVPPELVWTAEQIFKSEQIRGDDASDGTANVLRNVLRNVVADPRLGPQGVIDPMTEAQYGGSENHWFVTGKQKGVKVLHLNGSNRMPQVRSETLKYGRWGMNIDAIFDLGVFAQSRQAIQKNTGA